MRTWLYKFFCLLLAAFICIGFSDAQQRKASQATKKKEKIERSYKKAYAKARKRTVKHRREIQTEATKERMDEADKRAKTYNKQSDPGFFERYFKRKRPPKK
jgi:thiamine biosynthesis lipoprotein ApbE